MPDIVATRPADGAPIDTAWGAEIHDKIEGMQSGSGSVVFTASPTSAELTVTFPRPFAGGPIQILLTAHSENYAICLSQGTGVTTSNFKVKGRYIPGTNASVSMGFFWLAIGPM